MQFIYYLFINMVIKLYLILHDYQMYAQIVSLKTENVYYFPFLSLQQQNKKKHRQT